jgi:hypothetical protein
MWEANFHPLDILYSGVGIWGVYWLIIK